MLWGISSPHKVNFSVFNNCLILFLNFLLGFNISFVNLSNVIFLCFTTTFNLIFLGSILFPISSRILLFSSLWSIFFMSSFHLFLVLLRHR
ncbi:hypothetical protein TorRG33x02_141310 [Trema orientale]|uniref:Uncharacterized protein n=1 Tax=Trema orientale TaxID=63057 RepID=A0A2P5EX38_TREOI|nr:hypothetical protein TorRG33x02_141310 [Trema orientale]